MADTQLSIAALIALLANNTAGDISAQDMRDLVETLRMGHGELSITSSAETSITDSVSFFPVNATTFALSGNAHNWDMNTPGQLRYIGVADRVVHCAVSWSLTSAGNNKVYHLTVCKNGASLVPSHVHRKIATGADVGTGAMHAFIGMSTNDYFECGIKNVTDTTNATFETLNLFAVDMPK